MKERAVFVFIFLCCCAATEVSYSPAAAKAGADKAASGLPVNVKTAAFAESDEVRRLGGKQISVPSSITPTLKPTGIEGNSPVYSPNLIHDIDGALGRTSPLAMPTPSVSFDGLSNFDNIAIYNAAILPPDMAGDVGPSHFVQAVNSLVRVFDKQGSPLTSAFRLSDLFAPLGTACSSRNDGDPVVLYDSLADRWLISQYCTNFPPFRQMIAVSKTGDPTGAYFLYEFVMPNIKLNDFPKFGVWPDGYYMSTEEFVGSDFVGTGVFAFDRTKMLAGDASASYIYFSRPSTTTSRLGNLLPADLDGLRPPPAGLPNVFAGYTATEYGDAQDAIRLFDFHADFIDPSASTFTERPESPLSVAAFDPTSPEGRADITQPSPGERLDSNSDRFNFRAAYRNLGTSETIVLDQTVRVPSDVYRAGVRVYELKRTTGAFSVTEQTTLGDPQSSRFIGAAAEDNQGNIAVGFSSVSDTKRPAVRYTGRLANEPSGTFREETSLIDGTGVQKAFGWRWGDYSVMSVDPADDCTFWITGEYFTLASEQFSDFTWLTRIGAFKFPECTPSPRGSVAGTVTNAVTGATVPNAVITAGSYSRMSAGNGGYGPLVLIPGSYTVTASASGYRPQNLTLNVANGQSITQNLVLDPVPVLISSGTSVSAESCRPNGAPDPGETVTINVSLQNTGALNAQNLTATLLAGGGVTAPGAPQNYGSLPVGGQAVTRPFSFTVDPAVLCGSRITLNFRLQDDRTELGMLAVPLQTGVPKVAFRENFDRTQQSGLPTRWSRLAVGQTGALDAARNWTVSDRRSGSGTKSAYSPDLNQPGIGDMTSPKIKIATPSARLTFRNYYDFETTFLRNRRYDGSLLEIKIGDGAWTDIIAAGGTFESGGYDGPIDACCQNPLRNQPGWSGKSGINAAAEFITTAVRLPPAAAGQLIQFRWRTGTDIGNSVAVEGQYIDDVLVTDGFTCGCATTAE